MLKGKLRVFYDFTGKLEELGPTSDLKVNDAEPRIVSLSFCHVYSNLKRVVHERWGLMCVFLPLQLEIIIVRSSVKRLVVRNGRVNLYNQPLPDIPVFSSTYYLGGVPQLKMPEKYERHMNDSLFGHGEVQLALKEE